MHFYDINTYILISLFPICCTHVISPCLIPTYIIRLTVSILRTVHLQYLHPYVSIVQVCACVKVGICQCGYLCWCVHACLCQCECLCQCVCVCVSSMCVFKIHKPLYIYYYSTRDVCLLETCTYMYIVR